MINLKIADLPKCPREKKFKYSKYIGKSGRIWFVPNIPNSADEILVSNNPQNTTNPNQAFQGFGGSTLKLPLMDGSIFELHGGWHSNGQALLEDTDINILDKHYMFVIVCEAIKYRHGYIEDFLNVYYQDTEWTLRLHNCEYIVQNIANKLQKTVAYWIGSAGGSTSFHKTPELIFHEDLII